jgi:EAL domain-containing protein (putative c-di-GMP-specific phosphodiesterase class I)
MDEFRFVHEGRRFRIGASVGLVPIDSRWPSQAVLLQAADTACYAAKEAGRNRVHVWFDTDQAMRAREGQTQWGSRLESALDEGGFVLYAQQIQSIQNPSSGLHCEVLLRLREPDGTIIAPGSFLPAAERFHMASRIDRWVVRSVFEWLASEGGSPTDIETIAVNLSGQSIGDRAFHRFVVQLLEEIPIDARKLCFEITETAAITNLADATAFIESIRLLGMRVALDDFGAGASSFGYLKNLPVDYLKIDGQFVRDINVDELDMAAVRCFKEVAKVVGVQTIAEFVETGEILDSIRDIGIDYAQGYLFHRPEPMSDLVARVRSASEAAVTRHQ